MKSTLPFLSSCWVKACPVILMLVCIGFADVHAQNYKPLDEAIYSVRVAITSLSENSRPTSGQSSGQLTAVQLSTSSTAIKRDYFTAFVLATQEKGTTVAEAVAKLDHQFSISSLPEPRKTQFSQARSALMELITQ